MIIIYQVDLFVTTFESALIPVNRIILKVLGAVSVQDPW